MKDLSQNGYIRAESEGEANAPRVEGLLGTYERVEDQRSLYNEETGANDVVSFENGDDADSEGDILLDEDAVSVMSLLPSTSVRKRWFLHAITNGALVQEFLFLFFQYAATAKGLVSLGVNSNVASTSAVPMSLADWVVNVLSVSVPADADSVLFPVREKLRGGLALFETIIKGISLAFSYSIGAAADALPLLALVPQDTALWQVALANYSLILANILPGATYYRLFNHAKIAKHMEALQSLAQHPMRPLKRLYQQPINILRYMEVSRSWMAVVGYRAINFAFIAQALGPYLMAPTGLSEADQKIASNSLALVALLATAINVMFSRLLPTFEQLACLDFDVVSREEYNAAATELRREAFSSWSNATRTVLSSGFMWLPNMVTAAGWTLLAHSLLDNTFGQGVLGAVIGGGSLINSAYVEHQARVSKKAVETIYELQPGELLDEIDDEIERRLNALYGIPHFHHVEPVTLNVPVVAVTDLADRLQQVSKAFDELAATFASHNMWLNSALVAVNIGARVARTIGFYGFMKTLATTLSEYMGANVSDEQILALSLILAPENFKNEFSVFDESMKSVMMGWQAKCYIEKNRLNRVLTAREVMSVCLRKSPYDFSLNDTVIALEHRRADLNLLSSRVSERTRTPLLASSDAMASQGSFQPVRSAPVIHSEVSRCVMM